jgi:hypothetical protein
MTDNEANAALDQPEPEGVTDEELLRTYGKAKREHCYDGPIDDWPRRAERAATVHGLRAVIAADRARWGRPAIQPVPVTEHPWEREGWCDAEGRCWLGRRRIGEDLGPCLTPVWTLSKPVGASLLYTESLPHYALPLPK